MLYPIFNLGISSEQDVVTVRQRARQISALLGFGTQDQVRIATAVSELARSAFSFALGGRVEFTLENDGKLTSLDIKIKSSGGEARSGASPIGIAGAGGTTGLEAALISAHRLMDSCEVSHEPGRVTVIKLRKKLGAGFSTEPADLHYLARQISDHPIANTYTEVQLQNKELLDTLAELRVKQDDLLALTQELEDTNRGVVALYAEIEEKADRLRQADEMKSRFLSNTSHELRTPLSSIRALSQILLDRIDGELTDEQEKQIQFIAQAATDLSELVNDLLDLAKIESGKTEVVCAVFSVHELFSALKGMLRPLSANAAVELVFEPPADVIELYGDEGKVSQILRNFISNALKFTERGSVRVTVEQEGDGDIVRFHVTDTGIGIAPENLQFVFEEFSQVESALQRRIKGTGLGLPLCRKLAVALGGRVELISAVNSGSRFTLVLPTSYRSATGDAGTQDTTRNEKRVPSI